MDRVSSSKDTSSTCSSSEYSSIVEALREGIEVKDRKWRTKTYRQCFLHSDAVRWMKKNQKQSEEGAVSLLNELREARYLQHVVDPHKPFKVDQSRKLYFCFVEDDQSHVQQHPSKETIKFMKQHQMSKQILKEVWQSSDEFVAMQTKLNRMASSITQLAERQMSTQTNLEIVHQCTNCLIQAMVCTGILLLILLGYTMFLAVMPISFQTNNGTTKTEMIAMTTLVICALLFVAQGSRLFSIWLSLDAFMLLASEAEHTTEEDDEVNSKSKQSPPQRGLGRRQSSVVLKEHVLRRPSMLQTMLSTRSLGRNSLTNSNTNKQTQQRQASDIPDLSTWPHRPVMVCVNSPVSPRLKVEATYGNGPCPIGKPFNFSSELFEGQILVRLRDIPNSDNPLGDEAYFSGRRRFFQTIVQGRFKESLPVSDVLTGHEFTRNLQNLPHPWILKAATNVISKLAPGAEIQVLGNSPTMLASLAATSQVVRGDEPGNEPDIASTDDMPEDCSMLGGKFSSGKVSAMGRKLHLSNPQRASKYTFDTETVYTFDFYQSLLNVNTYSLDMGLANINMAPILNGQPIQALCKTTDGRYLWSFQIWHESLLPPPTQ